MNTIDQFALAVELNKQLVRHSNRAASLVGAQDTNEFDKLAEQAVKVSRELDAAAKQLRESLERSKQAAVARRQAVEVGWTRRIDSWCTARENDLADGIAARERRNRQALVASCLYLLPLAAATVSLFFGTDVAVAVAAALGTMLISRVIYGYATVPVNKRSVARSVAWKGKRIQFLTPEEPKPGSAALAVVAGLASVIFIAPIAIAIGFVIAFVGLALVVVLAILALIG